MKPGSAIPALLAASVLLGAEPALRAEVATVMAANLTTAGEVYGDQAVRIFRALRPDVVLIQEFNVRTSRRAFVDAAFGTGSSSTAAPLPPSPPSLRSVRATPGRTGCSTWR